MRFCVTCKEIVDRSFTVLVTDTGTGEQFSDVLCKECYERLKSSHHTEGIFALHSAMRWIRWRRTRRQKNPPRHISRARG